MPKHRKLQRYDLLIDAPHGHFFYDHMPRQIEDIGNSLGNILSL